MRLKQLQQELQAVKFNPSPRIELEQYPTSAHLAAQMLYTMHSQFGDVEDKVIADFGCGGAILGIGACMLGAAYVKNAFDELIFRHVIGFDVDKTSLAVAADNINELEVGMDLVLVDIEQFDAGARAGMVDTVVMNPPFGTRKKGIDMLFLEKAVQLSSSAVYSLHKSSTREHIMKKLASWGCKGTVLAQMRFDIPSLYAFHRKKSVDIEVDMIRVDVRGKKPFLRQHEGDDAHEEQ